MTSPNNQAIGDQTGLEVADLGAGVAAGQQGGAGVKDVEQLVVGRCLRHRAEATPGPLVDDAGGLQSALGLEAGNALAGRIVVDAGGQLGEPRELEEPGLELAHRAPPVTRREAELRLERRVRGLGLLRVRRLGRVLLRGRPRGLGAAVVGAALVQQGVARAVGRGAQQGRGQQRHHQHAQGFTRECVVSHSRALGNGAVELAREVIGDVDVPIAVAAGLDETTLGTDAAAIATAIATSDRGAGVVVLMDLGSAVLSAELALDLLEDVGADPATRGRTVLSAGPLVEGLVVAAATASTGADRHQVSTDAAAALGPKRSHLGLSWEPTT